jgi:hypothetical protein
MESRTEQSRSDILLYGGEGPTVSLINCPTGLVAAIYGMYAQMEQKVTENGWPHLPSRTARNYDQLMRGYNTRVKQRILPLELLIRQWYPEIQRWLQRRDDLVLYMEVRTSSRMDMDVLDS